MKSFRKLLAGIVLIAMLSVTAGGAFALDTEFAPDPSEQPLPSYLSFTGTIKEINSHVDNEGNTVDGIQYLLTENAEGGLANFRITPDTYYVTDNELRVGAEITGFYDARAVHILIYPARYEAKVLAVDLPEGQSIKVDTFDENMLSADRQLKLNISDETKIVLQNGETFRGELKGKNLAVLYTFTTRSIPAQTSPVSITVLDAMDIVVDEMKIEAPATYIKEDGTIMVPVRAVAEALGYEVGWDYKTRQITLNDEISFVLHEDSYSLLEKSTVQLGVDSELIDGRCYVPLSFFEKVVDVKQAETFEGKVVINSGKVQTAQ